MSNVSDKNCRENQNIYFMFSNFVQKSCFYDTMWKNMVELDRAHMWQCNMAHVLCMLDNLGKNRDIHSEYWILIAFPWQKWLREQMLLCLDFPVPAKKTIRHQLQQLLAFPKTCHLLWTWSVRVFCCVPLALMYYFLLGNDKTMHIFSCIFNRVEDNYNKFFKCVGHFK